MGADVCLITDGDADRMGIGDENGRFVNQLEVYALMALYFLEVRGERGAIVKTLSTTSMLEKLGKLYDVPGLRRAWASSTSRQIMELDAMLGGEESGGYAFRGNVPERDGILGNLYHARFHGEDGQEAERTAGVSVQQSRRALLRSHRYALLRPPSAMR